ncbi:MAG: GAF domain-containing protein [Gammaproteobacteria bacterium]|nr:GAF domain-containing protein [Gammaproteobacteria bacterium]
MDKKTLLVSTDPAWWERLRRVAADLATVEDGPLPAQNARIALVFLPAGEPVPDWCRAAEFLGLICSTDEHALADVTVNPELSDAGLRRLVETALRFWRNRGEKRALTTELALQAEKMHEITQIGIALTAEKELPRLLATILREGRKLGRCEAASLFLIESGEAGPNLRFKLFQNEALPISLPEKTFPLNANSIAGYVALTGEMVNATDVYELSPELPYHFDPSFDRTHGYRTRELLCLPMPNLRGEIMGVLQFLNIVDEDYRGQAFDHDTCALLQALASQAAVAIDNSLLLENIRELFEGFVAASVMAIESRDPVTSGHSFRVADYTCGLAEVLERAPERRLREAALSRSQMRELRYAALLHDFGKVGVREHVLQKAKKLSGERMDLIRLRIQLLKERLLREFAEHHPDCPHCQHGPSAAERVVIAEQVAELDAYSSLLEQANEPSVLHRDDQERLGAVRAYRVPEVLGLGESLLDEEEFLALSVTRGSLTHEERQEIESHVTHTYAFLKKIPWTRDLMRVPEIAAAHHEKLDGTGYPFSLAGEAVPVQSRMMTISDIYDALTARDRPYKSAVPTGKALDILQDEAKHGKLDGELLDLFIAARIFDRSA